MNETIPPYVIIGGSDGAVASVYFMDNLIHEVHYKDKTGKRFFTEKFEMIPIDIVEKLVTEWSTGQRALPV